MPVLKPSDIKDEVKTVLNSFRASHPQNHPFVTAYQILEKLSPELKNRLISERCPPGQGGGKPYSAASVVSDAAEMLDVEIKILDTTYLKITCNGADILAGNPNVGLYRLLTK